MKDLVSTSLLVVYILIMFPCMLYALDEPYDFLAEIYASPDTIEELGIQKLTEEEKANLNTLLNTVYKRGIRQGNDISSLLKKETSSDSFREGIDDKLFNSAYTTIIDSYEGNTLKLINGAEIEITAEYPGDLGYKKRAILYNFEGNWKILVEGKTPLQCKISKMPIYGVPIPAREVIITEIKGDCYYLVLADGTIYEPRGIYPVTRLVWERNPKGLLINNKELINLGVSSERIEVSRVN